MRSYIPEIHDPIHKELNQKWRRTDMEVCDEMGFTLSTIQKHRKRLGLPTNHRPAMRMIREPLPAPEKLKVNPIVTAAHWLGSRLKEKPSGYWLDGLPVNLDTIMQETNRLRKKSGVEQITHCSRWVI